MTHNNWGAKVRLKLGLKDNVANNLGKYAKLDDKVFAELAEEYPSKVLDNTDAFLGIDLDFAATTVISNGDGKVLLGKQKLLNKLNDSVLCGLAIQYPFEFQDQLLHIDPTRHSQIATAMLDADPNAKLILEYGDWKQLDKKVADELVKRGQSREAVRELFESFDTEGQKRIIGGIVKRGRLEEINSLSSKLGCAGVHGDFFISRLCSTGQASTAGNLLRDHNNLSPTTRQNLVSKGQGDAAMRNAKSFGPKPTQSPKRPSLGR